MFGDNLWAVVVVAGFLILGGVMAFAALRNKTTRREDAQTEAATRANYARESADDAAQDRGEKPLH